MTYLICDLSAARKAAYSKGKEQISWSLIAAGSVPSFAIY